VVFGIPAKIIRQYDHDKAAWRMGGVDQIQHVASLDRAERRPEAPAADLTQKVAAGD
jgi:hypothetical protein